MAKDKDFKFGMCAPRDRPDMTLKNFSQRGGAGQGHVTCNFCGDKC